MSEFPEDTFPVLPEELKDWKIKENMAESLVSSVWLIERNTDNEEAVLKILCPRDERGKTSCRMEGEPESTALRYGESREDISARLDAARAAASCPHMAELLHSFYDEETGTGYLIMPLYMTLYDYRGQHKFSPEDVLRVGMELSEALEALHKKGLIHSDIKPENVFLDAEGASF